MFHLEMQGFLGWRMGGRSAVSCLSPVRAESPHGPLDLNRPSCIYNYSAQVAYTTPVKSTYCDLTFSPIYVSRGTNVYSTIVIYLIIVVTTFSITDLMRLWYIQFDYMVYTTLPTASNNWTLYVVSCNYNPLSRKCDLTLVAYTTRAK